MVVENRITTTFFSNIFLLSYHETSYFRKVKPTTKPHYYNDIRNFGLVVGCLLLLNIIAAFVFARIDLTKEKKYSLTPQTKTLLKNLEGEVFVKIYLEGSFPAGFKRLQTSIKEMLDEFKVIAGANLNYEFINPSDFNTEKEQLDYYKDLASKGLQPMNLQVKEEEAMKEQYIFPGALVSYKRKELPITFLNNQIGLDPQVAINGSIAMLEYNLANIINKLQKTEKPKIAFTEGHGELNDLEIKDVADALSEFYEMHRLDITKQIRLDTSYKAIVIARPSMPFSDKDKWKLDQYVMQKGKLLWAIEPVIADMDSMQSNNDNKTKIEFAATDLPLQLEDLLFNYGVRINTDLIQDIQCNVIPIVVGMKNNTPQNKNFPWLFYPLITPEASHPIVKNLDLVMSQFASSIDTIRTKSNIKKTILLSSSAYSRALNTPVNVSLDILKNKPAPEQFNQKNLAMAVLCEGAFVSNYKNKLTDATAQMLDTLQGAYKPIFSVDNNKMIVMSDAAFIKNDVKNGNKITPIGYYKFTNQTFANKDFIINCLEYLIDESGLIACRSKDVKLRLLDKGKTKLYATKYKLINLALPLMILLLSGIVYYVWRLKKYTY